MRKIIFYIGKALNVFSSVKFIYDKVLCTLYTGYCSIGLSHMGKNVVIQPYLIDLKGRKYISIDDASYIGKGVILTAWHTHLGRTYSPEIRIGKNCGIGMYSHLTAINGIYIGDNVLTGPQVLITDNSHGRAERSQLDINPSFRELYSKGPVIVEDNVWIGEKASIMPGVKIGKGCIVAANSVVTHSIPPYCVVAGVPAKIVNKLK